VAPAAAAAVVVPAPLLLLLVLVPLPQLKSTAAAVGAADVAAVVGGVVAVRPPLPLPKELQRLVGRVRRGQTSTQKRAPRDGGSLGPSAQTEKSVFSGGRLLCSFSL